MAVGAVSRKKERLLRAAVLVSAAAFEGWTNFLASKLIQSGVEMSETQRDVLEEKKRVIENGVLKPRPCIYKSRERFLLLFRTLNGGADPGEAQMAKLDAAFKVRDELVHPKPKSFSRLSEDQKGSKAIMGFLVAELLLVAVCRGALEKLVKTEEAGKDQGGRAEGTVGRAAS